MRILPIASGKGGVGKSLVAANLAILLAQAGKRVLLADLDLGGSNLHLILGQRGVSRGIGTFLASNDVNFEDVVLPTEWEGLSFVPGDSEIPGLANITTAQKRTLISRLSRAEYDFVVLDLGAGTSFNTLDFFLTSGRGLVVTTPTPTATVNAYLFLKNAVFRIITSSFKRKSPAATYLEKVRKDAAQMQRIYVMQFLENIRTIDPESYAAYQKAIAKFRPRLILNMLEDPKDADKANKLRRSCREYLGVDVEHLGIVYRDDLQDIALQSRMPIVVYKPSSVLSQALFRVADKLIQLSDEEDAFEVVDVDDTYSAAEMEAEIDFESKMDYVEDLLHTGALTPGDLVETVRSQQYEITHLKRENQLLKSKLLKAAAAGFRL